MKAGITPAVNSTFAIGGVSCSKDTFVVNQSLVLRIKIYRENRHLRPSWKPLAAFLGRSQTLTIRT
jgi:hypothetical protein